MAQQTGEFGRRPTLVFQGHRSLALRQPKLDLRGYVRNLAVSDVLVVGSTIALAQSVNFDDSAWAMDAAQGWHLGSGSLVNAIVAIGLMFAWLGALRIFPSYSTRYLGHGTEEYSNVLRATLSTFGTLALISYALHLPTPRGLVLIGMPLGLLALLVERWLWRRWLNRRRREGALVQRVLVVGDANRLGRFIDTLDRTPDAGYRVVAACSTTLDGSVAVGRVPVVGGEHDAAEWARRLNVDVVAIASSYELGNAGVRQLCWDLEDANIEMVLVPALTDITGPRIKTRPVNGVPLIHVEQPVFTGSKLIAKALMDRLGATAILLALTPVLAVIALIVKLGDGGRIFYTQERIGLDGRPFKMLKFRSMVPNAHALKQQMISDAAANGESMGPLFKMKDDPRVTRVGRVLRRYSLDELPQLFNVLNGKMSLVGPRPPLAEEVASYDDKVRRRLKVRPGLTGLWQVSGRSNLSWDEAVRFDLFYVENWSVMGDLMILFRTFKAVVSSDGAY